MQGILVEIKKVVEKSFMVATEQRICLYRLYVIEGGLAHIESPVQEGTTLLDQSDCVKKNHTTQVDHHITQHHGLLPYCRRSFTKEFCFDLYFPLKLLQILENIFV